MSAAVSAGPVPDAVNVWLRPTVDGCEIKVDGKDVAVRLRQQLVRFGVHCTFPMPTWKGSQHVLQATYTEGIGRAEVERMIAGLDGYKIVSRWEVMRLWFPSPGFGTKFNVRSIENQPSQGWPTCPHSCKRSCC